MVQFSYNPQTLPRVYREVQGRSTLLRWEYSLLRFVHHNLQTTEEPLKVMFLGEMGGKIKSELGDLNEDKGNQFFLAGQLGAGPCWWESTAYS